jgi:uncharacterized protein (DUF58 family)
MFNENWVALTLFALLIGLLFHQSSLLLLSLLILTAAAAGWVWNKYSLHRVSFQRSFSEHRLFLGETVELTVQATNAKWLPVSWLRIDDEYPLAITLLEGATQPSNKPDIAVMSSVMSLRWFDRARWLYRLRCDKRGVYAFGPARLQSGDLFGLFSSEQVPSKQDWVVVYPPVRPIHGLVLPPKEPFGETRADQWLFEDPSRAAGIRDYAPGDGLKRVHWKASARQQRLQSKVYEPTTTFQVVLFLNMATLPRPWHGSVPELLERGISVAASIASEVVAMRYQVGVFANGCWPQSDQPLKVQPSRSPDQLTRVLEALAAVSAVPTISIEALLNKESPQLPWGATLVVVTAVVTEDLLAVMARLHTFGRKLVLVCLTDAALPFSLPGVLVERVQETGGSFCLRVEPQA